jgi:hypothetical protein
MKFPGPSAWEFFCASFGDESREIRTDRVLAVC